MQYGGGGGDDDCTNVYFVNVYSIFTTFIFYNYLSICMHRHLCRTWYG